MLRTRRQSLDVGEGKRALGSVELAFLRVPLEHPGDIALAGGDDHEIGIRGIFFEIGRCRLFVFDRAAALFEFLHPARKFYPLIDRLRWLVEHAVPLDRLVTRSIGRRYDEADRIDCRTFLVPEIQSQFAFVAQCLVEHALARHHFAVADVVAFAVLHEADLVTGRQKTVAELQARLAAADDRDDSFRTHRPLL